MADRTKYDLINKNLETIIELRRNGLVSNKLMTHLIIFEKFHNMDGSKEKRYKELGNQYNLKPDTIFRIIKKLNQKSK